MAHIGKTGIDLNVGFLFFSWVFFVLSHSSVFIASSAFAFDIIHGVWFSSILHREAGVD